MMIRVTFEADDVVRLREQIELFLAGPRPTLKERIEASKGPFEQLPLEPPPPKKTKAKAPEPEPEEEEDILVKPDVKQAVDLLKLKEQQLDRLRELFNAGKGTYVRELLAKFGNGAKVFPEVDAAQFPEIKKAIDKELGA